MRLPEIPNHWTWADFSEVAEVKSNLVNPGDYSDYPHIAPNHIESKTGELLEYTTIAKDGVTSSKHRFFPGQILYSKIRPYLAKAVAIDIDGLCSADMYPVKAKIDRGFLLKWMLSDWFTEQASSKQGRTVLPKINQAALAKLKVPVPPHDEQHRIVARMEELTARTKTAKQALQAIRPLLEKFRQSVLAAACRGDLTAEWRAEHSIVESAEVLLDKVRRYRHESPQNSGRKEKSPAPGSANLADLPKLPPGWCWSTLGELAAIQGGIQKQPSRQPATNAYPFLRVANVQSGRLLLEDVHQIELFGSELEKLRLSAGDLLIVEGNGSANEIGRMAVWDGSIPDCVHQNHLIRARPVPQVLPQFLQTYWNSPAGKARVFRQAKTTSGLYTLSVSKIADLPVPLAPFEEQKVLVQMVDNLLNQHLHLDALIAQLHEMERSILSKAFRGELVARKT